MALTATVHRYEISLSDVDRGVYEELDLRVARHPSESMRYMLTRVLAYCLSYEEGLAFSKGGLSSTDEPPLAVRDLTGALRAWIDVGSPSAERLHKATKLVDRVVVYTHVDPALLRREVATRPVHRVDEIELWRISPDFLDALEAQLDRHGKLDLMRQDGKLYVTVGGKTVEGELTRESLG